MPDQSRPWVWVDRLSFSGGSTVSLGQNDIFVLVGPNNSGKSETLRAIYGRVISPSHTSPVVSDLHFSKAGDLALMEAWVKGFAFRQPDQADARYFAFGDGTSMETLRIWWRATGGLEMLGRWFVKLVSTEDRLTTCKPVASIRVTRDAPTHPIHILYRDEEFERRISDRFRDAFGLDLIVHRVAGNEIPLHVGQRPIPGPGHDRLSNEFVRSLEELPTLEKQGDGMRSFAGVLLSTSLRHPSLMLVDEPEAFLHPPQARLAGLALAQERLPGRQLFIATHSADVLKGLLDSNSSDVRVARIERRAGANVVKILDHSDIDHLWRDPLLRHSNIFDALFHEGVVICESDGDCRFFSAILESRSALPSAPRKPDLMFTHCGGKDRLPVVIRALRAVGVPVRAVADFDLLSGERTFRAVAEAFEMDWATIESDWKLVNSAITRKKAELNTQDVKNQIDQLFADINTSVLPAGIESRVKAILKQSSPWALAKEAGKAFVPSGEATVSCERLLANLRQSGLYIIEQGELECFCKSVGNHGPAWVNKVLDKDLASDRELDAARRFVAEISNFEV